MTTQALQVRRATIEDLSQLIELWQTEQLPIKDLEKRFKEFQVVEDSGKLIAALGIHVAGGEGLLHSEAFAYPEQADALREKLCERARMIAGNHGLFRIWTQMNTPYWRSVFQEASEELRARLPPAFGNEDRPWFYQQLRDEAASGASLDKEFALFREAEREQTEKLFRQARVLKFVAVVMGAALFALVVLWAIMFFKAQQRVKQGSQIEPPIRMAAKRWTSNRFDV